MTYFCKLSDKSLMKKSKDKHSKSLTHHKLDMPIIRRYIILKPIISEVDEIMKRYINICKKKYQQYEVRYILNLLTTANRVRYFRVNTKLKLDYSLNFPENSILSRIDQDRYYFSHI